jgi:hypothetical protein
MTIPRYKLPVWVDGECLCDPVRTLYITSLGPQDDDLRVDVFKNGSWVTISDTLQNVSAYNGTVVGGFLNFNPSWPTSGFRALELQLPGVKGDPVRVWTADLGGFCTTSQYTVKIVYWDWTESIFVAGFNQVITPPNWPPGTIGPPAELVKTAPNRPWSPFPPGSPPIYTPNGQWTL